MLHLSFYEWIVLAIKVFILIVPLLAICVFVVTISLLYELEHHNPQLFINEQNN